MRYHPIFWNWISLTGKDTADFLQRMSTQNIKKMAVGSGARGCFLESKGKIQGFFTIWRYGETEFGLEHHTGPNRAWTDRLVQYIDKYLFSEDVSISVLSSPPSPKTECVWIFPSKLATDSASLELLQMPQMTSKALDEQIRICRHSDKTYGYPWITAWGVSESLEQWIAAHWKMHEEVPLERLHQWRIESLSPTVDLEILADDHNPLEVGIHDAIALNKGCYPGQEVLEKTVSVGSPARRLVQLTGETTESKIHSSFIPGTDLHHANAPDQIVGRLGTTAFDGKKFAALAVVRKLNAQIGFEIDIAGSRAKIAKVVDDLRHD